MDSGGVSIGEVVTSGDKNGLRLLLASGADVNQTNRGGQTPLVLAIVSGHVRLLPLLLEAGANPLLRDSTGLNAIEWAERKGLSDIAKQLKERTTTGAPKPTFELSDRAERVVQEPRAPSSSPEASNKASIADDEKSRRWIAGIKQRLDEKASRLQTANVDDASDAQTVGVEDTLDEERSLPDQSVTAAQDEISHQREPDAVIVTESSSSAARPRVSSLKRCPQCNTVYNSNLVAYCAFHVVPLVDVETPVAAAQEDQASKTLVLWLLVIITFLVAAFIGLFFFLPRGNRSEQGVAPSSTPTPVTMVKGTPVTDSRLKTKIVDLPAAQTVLKIDKPETVVVRVRIDSTGRVSAVQSSAANEELRRAAIEAARNATFSADKLRRERVGTITYRFNP